MIYLFRFLFGYVEFSFLNGFTESFLNKCFEQGVEIRDVKKYSNAITARCNIKTYKKLHIIARESGGRLKIMKKVGVPFFVPKLKNRMGFFAGIVLFCVILSFLNSFVWNIEIVGNEQLSDTTVLSFLENNSLKSGAMWSSVDRKALKWQMMSEFDEISWVHINRNGATAVVEINESTPPKKEYDENVLQGVGAFSEKLEATAYRNQSDIRVSSVKQYKQLLFFTAKIPLYITHDRGDVTDTKISYLKIFDKSLPVGVQTTTEKYLTVNPVELTDKQLKTLAKKKLRLAEKQELDEYEIVNRSIDVTIDSDKAVAKGRYIVRLK